MKFEILHPKKHNRDQFDCGVESLNLYLQRIANQDQKRSLSRVYVLADRELIIGYYTLSAHSVRRDHLPLKRITGGYEKIPFLLLGRLAVDKQFQKKGFGDMLMYHAFKTTTNAAQTIGIMGIIVDAKNESAATFYEGFGFMRLLKSYNRLVLPIQTINHIISKV
jgi:ribosomal protein S18 acetylase RimI-like enzyme